MLYDNAQLARVYLHAWQVTGEPFFRKMLDETFDCVVREEEGMFFVWTPDEICDILGHEADRLTVACIGLSERYAMLRGTNLPARLHPNGDQETAEARCQTLLQSNAFTPRHTEDLPGRRFLACGAGDDRPRFPG
jgi:uncharacterized protein YyaL (SSP411 family)